MHFVCVCLRRPKPFVCTHRERINLRAEREKQSRLMNDPLLVGGCELVLYNIRSNMYPADQEKTFAIICLFFVCVCAALLCAVSGTCSWCSIFFFFSAVLFLFSYREEERLYRTIRLILSFFLFSLNVFRSSPHTDRGTGIYVHADPPLFFVPLYDG